MKHVYTIWFKDTLSKPEDQDYDWPTCIIIDANNEDEENDLSSV